MSSELPILYTFRRCPYAMRARMALTVSGQKCEWREVLLRDKPEAMLEASDKGTVPVIVMPDGAVIDESIDVMNWALAKNDPENWLAPDREEMNALIVENDGPFKHHLDRYKYSTRYEDADPKEHREEGEKFLRKLEGRLAKNTFLFGPKLTYADIAIFPFVRQFRIADMEWFDAAPYPQLQRWLNTCMEMPLFKRIMKKRDPWKPGDDVALFPPPA